MGGYQGLGQVGVAFKKGYQIQAGIAFKECVKVKIK